MNKNTPTLRFSEQHSGWKIKKLKDIAPLQRGFDLPTTNVVDGKYPVVYSNGIGRYHNEFKAKSPGLVTGRSGTIGALTYVEENYWPHNTSLWVTEFIDCLPKFAFYLYQKVNLKRFATGSGVPTLNRNDVHDYSIHIPEIHEQQKITDFLSSVDTKISQLTEKHRLLKEYKKGVMQQIFSQKIRFKDKDDQAFPDWVVHPLSKLASKITTKNKGRKIKAVLTNSAKYGIISQQDYFEKDIAREDNTDNYCVVNVDDFVYNPRISDLAPVGPIGRNKVEQGIMSPLYTVFRINSDCCLDFYEYFFCSNLWHRYMYSIANFGARHDRMNITSSDFMALPCPSPCVQEQQKIAEFLQSLDSKINAVAEQVEQTKQFKKGLLQQMFV